MRDEWSPYGDGTEQKKRHGKEPTGLIAREQLKSIVERIETLEMERSEIGDDIKQVYAEAKANSFDTKVLRQVIRLRKKDLVERQEEDALRDLYMQALGMIEGGTA